jgi:small subunit ribosomal protein S6
MVRRFCEPTPGAARTFGPPTCRIQGRISFMALYEHMLIARQDISAQAVDALATHLKTIVETEGGKVEKQEYWGLRTLAFRIKKNRKGHYVLLNLNAPANAIFELERQLKINEDVLRFLTVRVEAFEQSNSSRKREREAGREEGRERRPRADGETVETEGAEA